MCSDWEFIGKLEMNRKWIPEIQNGAKCVTFQKNFEISFTHVVSFFKYFNWYSADIKQIKQPMESNLYLIEKAEMDRETDRFPRKYLNPKHLGN